MKTFLIIIGTTLTLMALVAIGLLCFAKALALGGL